MLQQIQITPTNWQEVTIPQGQYSLIFARNGVVFYTETQDETDIDNALVLKKLNGFLDKERKVYLKSDCRNEVVYLTNFSIRV